MNLECADLSALSLWRNESGDESPHSKTYRANGKIGSMSTGTLLSLSNALFI